jgi:uridine kinase
VKNTGVLIGISGPSGSGKSLIAQSLSRLLPTDDVVILQEDSYYKDLSDMPFDERIRYNFDHPNSFDHSLLIRHLIDLKNGKMIEHPVYDYKTHTRREEARRIGPYCIIILEGIMIFTVPELRDLMNYKIYVDTPLDTCFIRRLSRDMQDRGRSMDSVIQQYLATVRPMYFKYIEPTKEYVDLLIPNDGQNINDIENISIKITEKMKQTLKFL